MCNIGEPKQNGSATESVESIVHSTITNIKQPAAAHDSPVFDKTDSTDSKPSPTNTLRTKLAAGDITPISRIKLAEGDANSLCGTRSLFAGDLRAAGAASVNFTSRSTTQVDSSQQGSVAEVTQLELDLSIHKIKRQPLPDHLKQKYIPIYKNGYEGLFPDLGPKEFKLLGNARLSHGISPKEFREFLKWSVENWERAISAALPCMLHPPESFSLTLLCSKHVREKFYQAYLRRDKPSYTPRETKFIRSLMEAGGAPKLAMTAQNHFYLSERLARFRGCRQRGSRIKFSLAEANKMAFITMQKLGYTGHELDEAGKRWKWGEMDGSYEEYNEFMREYG